VRQLTYLAVLAGCLVGTLPLEFALGARVYRQWRRLVLAVVPVAVVFTVWDIAAIHYKWWTFDPRYVTGIAVGLPLEELLFFIVVPVCAVLTLEGVRRVRPDWSLDATCPTAPLTSGEPTAPADEARPS
jgi:lycopene cyclase domain-containing protein